MRARRSGKALFQYKKRRGQYLGTGPRQGDEEAIKRLFTPEFCNRPDAVIAFAPLSRDTIDRVVEKFVLELKTRLIERDVIFDMTPEATRRSGENGYDVG